MARPKFLFKRNRVQKNPFTDPLTPYLPKNKLMENPEAYNMVYRAFVRIEKRKIKNKISALPSRLRKAIMNGYMN